MKFSRESDILTPVQWYYTENEEFPTFPITFCSSNWDQTPKVDGCPVGEQVDGRKNVDGKFPANGAPCCGFCGTEDQWLNGFEVSPDEGDQCSTPCVPVSGCSCSRGRFSMFPSTWMDAYGCSCARGSVSIVTPTTITVVGCSCGQQGGIKTGCSSARVPLQLRVNSFAPDCPCLNEPDKKIVYQVGPGNWFGSESVMCGIFPTTYDLSLYCTGATWGLGSSGTGVMGAVLLPDSTEFPFYQHWQLLPNPCPDGSPSGASDIKIYPWPT